MESHKATPGDIVVQTFVNAVHEDLGLPPEAVEVACFLEEGMAASEWVTIRNGQPTISSG